MAKKKTNLQPWLDYFNMLQQYEAKGFLEVKPAEHEAYIARYRDDCETRGIQRMYAQGYLNHRRWEDEQEDPTPTLPCMGGSDMHRSDATAAKGNYSPPSQEKATGRRDSGNEDGGGSLPDMAIW